LFSKLAFFTCPKKLFEFAMNLQVHGRVDGVCDGHRRSLVEAELPQHAIDVVLSTHMMWTSGVFVSQK
jgi:hypothetical protein